MSLWTRMANVFRGDSVSREIEEEIAAHVAEAVEHGRDPVEARRALGPALQYREDSRDVRLFGWLDSLRADAIFAWRQLKRNRAASAAAIFSLALATGATTAAFRLVDAVLWRNLPVAEPGRLFYLATSLTDPRTGRPDYRDDFDYPTFLKYRQTVGDRAELMVVGMSARTDVIFGAPTEPERLYRQFLSGNVMSVFGLRPAIGRLLMPADDAAPGGSPVAVLTYQYWTRRFGRDPAAIGKSFRMGSQRYEIVGVAPEGFTGTEPGAMTDAFIPATMNTAALNSPGWSWFRTWVRPKPGFTLEQVRQPLQAALALEHQEHLKTFEAGTPQQTIDAYMSQAVMLLPAAAGASGMQKEFRRPLLILGILVTLVLLVACANVANLLTAQAAVRARELALRISIGAGQWRLMQMVLVESAMLATLASAAGAFFAWWSAPLVVAMLAPPEDPVRLALDIGWRALAFGVALTIAVTFLFGLSPALRASRVKPISALKGGEDPHARRRLMNSLIGVQVALCVLVQFAAGLFVATFERLSSRPLGFAYQHLMIVETGTSGRTQPPEIWMQVADRLRQTPGVESVTEAGWAPLSGNHWTGNVRVAGRPLEPRSPYLLDVSPGYFETLKIGIIGGRDFRPGDIQPQMKEANLPVAGVGIVNETFARTYFDGENPVGKTVYLAEGRIPLEIVGLVHDSNYSSVRETVRPVVYLPIAPRNGGTLLVRTAGNPVALAPVVRRAISQARPDFRVRNIEMQEALVRRQMVREKLLATLSLFFAMAALLLAGIGLYGALNYSVIQQHREIGIRMALGASSASVIRAITTDGLAMVCLGTGAGLAAGMASERFVAALLFEVKATDPGIVAAPLLILMCAVVLAALPPAIRAVRIDPAETLRM